MHISAFAYWLSDEFIVVVLLNYTAYRKSIKWYNRRPQTRIISVIISIISPSSSAKLQVHCTAKR